MNNRLYTDTLISCIVPHNEHRYIWNVNTILYPSTPDLTWPEYLTAFNSFETMIKTVDDYKTTTLTKVPTVNDTTEIRPPSDDEVPGDPDARARSRKNTKYTMYHPEYIPANAEYTEYLFNLIAERKVKYTIDLRLDDKTSNVLVWDVNNHVMISANETLMSTIVPNELRRARSARTKLR